MKLELHIHTSASPESTNTIDRVIPVLLRQKIDCVVVCDHNTIDGALELAKKAPFEVIVGEEIETKEGEIIGLFLTHAVGPHLSAKETIDGIKKQGGLVYLPHPCDNMRRKKIDLAAIEDQIAKIDIIEVFNARSLLGKYNKAAEKFASGHNLITAPGSDAHTPGELGKTYLEIKSFTTPQEFLANLKDAKMVTEKANPLVHVATLIQKIKARI